MKDASSTLFSRLFSNFQNRFLHFAQRYVRDWAVAEDIVMDAFIYYWENKHRLPEDTNVPAYILTSIKNKCLSHLRHLDIKENVANRIQNDLQWELSNRIARLEVFEPYEIFSKEIMDLVDKTLQSLPMQTREIFILSRYEGLSQKEIAKRLNISTKTVEFHISKAIRVLRVELKDYLPLLFLICLN
jgi:RNA polymerase sigma-70 factor (ECF subfamily)